MARKKKEEESPEALKQRQHEFELQEIVRRLNLIPEPTYRFNITDSVKIGNLEDVIVNEILYDGKIYEIDYTDVEHNYGKPIRTEHQKRYVTWLDIRKLPDSKESFIQNEDIRLNYSQRGMSDILGKVYFFGVNFEPEYQREFVWELEDKVALIDSIFNNVDIGKFVFIHYDSQQWQETGFGYEILDGKQRIRAIMDFYEDRFTYNGKHYSDLSYKDQWHFREYHISSAEVQNLTREQIFRYFIKLNTGGHIMAKEQIDKVKKMLEEIS